MPQIIQKGKKNMMYCSCDYCGSYISFYVRETKRHTTEVDRYVHTYLDIQCPACTNKIIVFSNGNWKDGVIDA